jgi:hypothetical protein
MRYRLLIYSFSKAIFGGDLIFNTRLTLVIVGGLFALFCAVVSSRMLRQCEWVLVIGRSGQVTKTSNSLKKIVAQKLVVIGGFEPPTSAL